MKPRRLTLAFLIVAIGVSTSCASYPVNPALSAVDQGTGYRAHNLDLGEGNTEETFVIVALSGGGMRAAALDFGVLRELADVQLPGGNTLLDELDILSSSSMASLVAAYYALHGQQAFLDDFEREVLYARIESAYTRRILTPWQWPRLWSRRFGRSELAMEYLDNHYFEGATFADMPRRRPMLLLGATDMSLGAQFTFVQGHFDRLCSDMDEVSVARAVTASLAFTGAFTPVTFRNYPSSECGYETPEPVLDLLAQGPEAGARDFDRARNWLAYEDENRKYVHLTDGGVSDNIGMRTVKLALTTRDAPWSIADQIENGTIQRLVIIIVDARAAVSTARDAKARTPKLTSSVLTSASAPLANFSTETVELVRYWVEDLLADSERFHALREACTLRVSEICAGRQNRDECQEQELSRCHEAFNLQNQAKPPEPDVYLINARLDLLQDDELREHLHTLPTRLQLPRREVDLLVESAGPILEATHDFQRLKKDLGADLD